MFQVAPFPSCPRVVFREKRDGNIKVGPKVLGADAGFGQHGKADVKAEVFCIVWPGARVQVENDVVFAPVPQREALDFCFQVVHILGWKLVPVQSVQTQDKQTCLSWVRCKEPGPFNRGQNVLIALWHLLPFLLGVDVNFESISLTEGEIKTGVHPTAFPRVNAWVGVPLLPRRYVSVVIVAPVSLPCAVRLQYSRDATPPRPGVITGEATVITPAGTPPG